MGKLVDFAIYSRKSLPARDRHCYPAARWQTADAAPGSLVRFRVKAHWVDPADLDAQEEMPLPPVALVAPVPLGPQVLQVPPVLQMQPVPPVLQVLPRQAG